MSIFMVLEECYTTLKGVAFAMQLDRRSSKLLKEIEKREAEATRNKLQQPCGGGEENKPHSTPTPEDNVVYEEDVDVEAEEAIQPPKEENTDNQEEEYKDPPTKDEEPVNNKKDENTKKKPQQQPKQPKTAKRKTTTAKKDSDNTTKHTATMEQMKKEYDDIVAGAFKKEEVKLNADSRVSADDIDMIKKEDNVTIKPPHNNK